MSVEYFAWSTLEVEDLSSLLVQILRDDRTEFDARVESETSDIEDWAATATYREELWRKVVRWCEHFEIEKIPLRSYDTSIWVPGGVQSWRLQVDHAALVAHLVRSLDCEGSELPLVYRPKVLERANAAVMRWLRTRPAAVDRLHHRSFEAIVAEVLREKGWQVELTKQTRDGGYDVLAIRTDSLGVTVKLIVECKLFGLGHPVGVAMVDRLVGVSVRERSSAMLVTNSRFTRTAWKTWQRQGKRDLSLVDRDALFEWLHAAYHDEAG
jgi:hypothetical protein